MKTLCTAFLFSLLLALHTSADTLSNYNVIWDSPSKDYNGSMPIGNGDIGINVWAEKNGDVILLLSKTDAWSENARLLKLGQVRLNITPNPFSDGNPFEQTLNLRQGEINIKAGHEEQTVMIKIWVDANHPVIRIETESSKPFDLNATLEIWRDEKRQLKEEELNSAYGLQSAPFPVYVYPDTVYENQNNQIIWHHRNQLSIWENNLKHQGLEEFITQAKDPLMNLTFGGCMQGSNLENKSPLLLSSTKPQKKYTVSIYPLTAQTETAEQWLDLLDQNVKQYSDNTITQDYAEHLAWWDEFWNRSWIYVSGSEDAEAVTRGYILQRWINACAGRGKHPIKFNGSIFTVNTEDYDPDYRRWGGPYWWQNTRLPYWTMLASGDFDMMLPLFNMYQDMMPLAEFRTNTWFKHKGAFIGETVYFWGMYNNENYGWDRDPKLPIGELTNNYIGREYTASLELLAMMIDYYQYTQDESFLTTSLLPMSDSFLLFWDQHYKQDQYGTLFIYPAQALETLQDAMNPTPDIAGLHWVLDQLLELDSSQTSDERIAFWSQLKSKLPELPKSKDGDSTYILGAEKYFGGRGNSENPELYTVFPFRLFGIGKPNLDIGKETFERRTVKGNNGWRQDDTQAAFLGLTKTAKDYLVDRAKHKHDQSRFPAFWGPNFDWIPDQDHGGNLMKALQTMLLQADDEKIYLTPAWSPDWNADFKLHAPQQTIVEGTIKDGKIVSLKVTPESRSSDVIFIESQ
jgi:hypothetical protein